MSNKPPGRAPLNAPSTASTKVPIAAIKALLTYSGSRRRRRQKVDWLSRLDEVNSLDSGELYLLDLIGKARRRAIALYPRFRKGQSVKDIWGSSVFPISLPSNSTVQRLPSWRALSPTFKYLLAELKLQEVGCRHFSIHIHGRRVAELKARGGDITARLRNALSKALRDRLGYVPMFIFAVENRYASGNAGARLHIHGTIEIIRKPLKTYAGKATLAKRSMDELKRVEDHLWHGIDPRQRRPKNYDPTSYMDCRTDHIPGAVSGPRYRAEAAAKVRHMAMRICEENQGFKVLEAALRAATGNEKGAASVWNNRGQRKNTKFDHPYGTPGYWAAYSLKNVHHESRILKDHRSAMSQALNQATQQVWKQISGS